MNRVCKPFCRIAAAIWRQASGGYVNVPPYEGSTILHDDMEDLFGRVDNHLYGDGTAQTYGTDARRMKLFMTP